MSTVPESHRNDNDSVDDLSQIRPSDSHESTDDALVITSDDVTLFRDIAGYFKSGRNADGKRVELKLTCPISEDMLEVPPKVSPNWDSRTALEQMAVLPCGHFFSFKTIDAWVRTRRREREELCCPLCRDSLRHPQCLHSVTIKPFDVRFEREMQLPLTIPEGGIVCNICPWCRMNHVRSTVGQLAEYIYPAGVPRSAFVDIGRFSPEVFTALSDGLKHELIDLFIRIECTFSHW